jgi:hypothetical protein
MAHYPPRKSIDGIRTSDQGESSSIMIILYEIKSYWLIKWFNKKLLYAYAIKSCFSHKNALKQMYLFYPLKSIDFDEEC